MDQEQILIEAFRQEVIKRVNPNLLTELSKQQLFNVNGKSVGTIRSFENIIQEVLKTFKYELEVVHPTNKDIEKRFLYFRINEIFQSETGLKYTSANGEEIYKEIYITIGQDDKDKSSMKVEDENNFGILHALYKHYDDDFNLALKDLKEYTNAVKNGTHYRSFKYPNSITTLYENLVFITRVDNATIGPSQDSFCYLQNFFPFDLEGNKNYWAHVTAENEALKDPNFVRSKKNIDALINKIETENKSNLTSLEGLAGLYKKKS